MHLTSDYQNTPITIALHAISAVHPGQGERGTVVKVVGGNDLSYSVNEYYHDVLDRMQAAAAL